MCSTDSELRAVSESRDPLEQVKFSGAQRQTVERPRSQKQRCASGARSAEQVSERRHSESARATSAALINYMHVHYNLISGREKEEPIVQIPKYEHSDYLVFNACVCMSTLVLFATPWQRRHNHVPCRYDTCTWLTMPWHL